MNGDITIDKSILPKNAPTLEPVTFPFSTFALYAFGPVIFESPAAK